MKNNHMENKTHALKQLKWLDYTPIQIVGMYAVTGDSSEPNHWKFHKILSSDIYSKEIFFDVAGYGKISRWNLVDLP